MKPFVPILAGGGTRLPAHVGVLAALQELEAPFKHIVGVSGGSIIGAFLATGYAVEEIRTLVYEINYSMFRGYSPYQLFFRGGLSSGQVFEDWLDGKFAGAVFADLQYDLHIVATDIRTATPVIFDRQHTPQVKLSAAVRCSMGIPLIYTFRQYGDKILIDGSILAENALRRDWAGDGSPVCSFRVRAAESTAARNGGRPPLLPAYVAMVIRTFMTTIAHEFIHDAHWHSTIIINSGGITPLEFKLTRSQKEQLFNQGYQSTLEYFPAKFIRHLERCGESLPQPEPGS